MPNWKRNNDTNNIVTEDRTAKHETIASSSCAITWPQNLDSLQINLFNQLAVFLSFRLLVFCPPKALFALYQETNFLLAKVILSWSVHGRGPTSIEQYKLYVTHFFSLQVAVF